MIPRLFFALVPSCSLVALLVASSPGLAGGPGRWFGGSSAGAGWNSYPASYYGYNLDALHPGYYGGINYREYYSYFRGYILSDHPGPVGPFPGRFPPMRYPLVPLEAFPPNPLEMDGASPTAAPAHIIVSVPAEAEVWIEGAKTTQSGAVRTYVSPPLVPREGYTYEIRARWKGENGEVDQTQELAIRAGATSRVTFPLAP